MEITFVTMRYIVTKAREIAFYYLSMLHCTADWRKKAGTGPASVLQWDGGSAGHRHRHGFGHLDPIDRRRQDAARVTGPLAGRKQPARVQTLQVAIAPLDADRRRGARLHARQQGVGMEVSLDLLVEGGEGFAHGGDRVLRQGAGQVG